MSRSIVLVLAVCVFSTYSAVIQSKDGTLNRIARSPHYGSSYYNDDDLPPPPAHGPPPPPILYHTQNWSGVAKGLGGTPQGVFSGAAASAQSAAPAISEAFSIASSGTGLDTSDEGGQVKENLGKSKFNSHSDYAGSGSHSSRSLTNKNGGVSDGFSSSNEGQYNIKSSELGFQTGASQSEESKSQSGQFSAGNSGFNKDTASVRSSGQFKSEDFGSESGQRSIHSSFGGKSSLEKSAGNGRPGDFKAHIQAESRDDIGSPSLTDDKSANRASIDFDSKTGQFNIDTSNNPGLASYNRQSDQFNAGSGFSDTSVNRARSSDAQFGRYNGQSSGFGYQRGGSRREFNNHGYGYGGGQSYHNSDNHRYGKSHEPHHFETSGQYFDNQGNAGQYFAENRQNPSNGFSDSQSSSFNNYRTNTHGSRSNGVHAGFSENTGQVEQFGHLQTADSQDFSGGQQEKQSGQLDFSKSQAGSSRLTGGQRPSNTDNSRYGFKQSGSLIDRKEEVEAGGKIKGAIVPASESQVPISAGVNASGQEDVQSTLGGALNLASQGLQAAQQTPCSSCDKGSYALSNAKSHSGSAIALSIGG